MCIQISCLIFSSSGVRDGISRKDEIYNSLVDKFQMELLDFPKQDAQTDGKYFVQVGTTYKDISEVCCGII